MDEVRPIPQMVGFTGMTDKPRTPGAGFIMTMGLVAIFAYGLSIGPSAWVSSRVGGKGIVSIVYRPLTWAVEVTCSNSVLRGIQWYSNLGTDGLWEWNFFPSQPGHAEWNRLHPDIHWTSGPSPPPIVPSP